MRDPVFQLIRGLDRHHVLRFSDLLRCARLILLFSLARELSHFFGAQRLRVLEIAEIERVLPRAHERREAVRMIQQASSRFSIRADS